ncbi:MAG: HDOD domain-containing protein [Chthonomonas sp.]|nr:HDOD domain-containing protein [Chthonomonas sp.]
MTLQELLCQAADLPSFPQLALRVARETEHSDACAASIADLMAEDQGLSTRVLRLANSSFFGVPRRIDSLREAIIILGLVNVRRLALAASTYSWFLSTGRGSRLPMALWSQSVGVATVAASLETQSPKVSETDLFTAGILADIGLSAMGAVAPEPVDRVFQLCRDELMALARAEQEVFGFSHEQVGAELATEWGFPDGVITCIRYHHWPHRAPDGEVAPYFLNLAAGLMSETNQGLVALGHQDVILPEVLVALGLETEHLEAARAGLQRALSMPQGILGGLAA